MFHVWLWLVLSLLWWIIIYTPSNPIFIIILMWILMIFSSEFSTGENKLLSGQNNLKRQNIPIFDHHDCALLWWPVFIITNNMLCFRGESSAGKGCNGDQGNPLACTDPKSGVTKLFGIMTVQKESLGNQLCEPTLYPDVFEKVSAVRSWIKENTGI